MKRGFYPKLAWEGIRKNRRLYLPYILTCIGMVMMFYIIHYLAAMPTLDSMAGGSSTKLVLGFGVWIIAVFALVFLLYTNSFLMRRRQKEFGLYNILGMGKGHLGKMLFLESVITTVASIIGGILAGILLGKLVYLILLKILHMGGKIEYRISLASIGMTTIFFWRNFYFDLSV